jgi:hypothetical protein
MGTEPALPEPAGSREEVAPRSLGAPSSRSSAFASGAPLLALLRPFAAFAVVALLVGRVVAPSVPGIAVGVGGLVHGAQLAGDFASQLLAIAATIAATAAVLVLVRARVSSRLRVASVVLGGFVVLTTLSASGVLVSRFVGTSLALAATLLALLCSLEAVRTPFTRVPAFALALTALAGGARVGSVYLAYRAADAATPSAIGAAHVAATVAAVIDVAAVGIAAGWLGLQREKLVSPALFVALLVAMALTRLVLGAEAGEGGPVAALARGVAERLLSKPEPALPHAQRVFVGFFAPIMALVGLGKRGTVPALSGALALALLVRSSPERPLQGLLLVVAALGLALASADGPQVWASLPPPAPRAPPRS